jgi:hypothetical protein
MSCASQTGSAKTRSAAAEMRCPATGEMRRACDMTAAGTHGVRSRATTAATSARGRDSRGCPTGYGNDGEDLDLCHGTLECPPRCPPDERTQPGFNQPTTVAKVPSASREFPHSACQVVSES